MRVTSAARLGEHRAAELELQVADEADEVGVAGALAVAVQRALHVRGAGLDRGDRVRDRAAGVVVAVDAQPRTRGAAHGADDVGDPAGSMPPLVSHSTTTSAPASAAVRTTSRAYSGLLR
jgi:hypothetical protein